MYLLNLTGAPGWKYESGRFINSWRKLRERSCGLTSSLNISYLEKKLNRLRTFSMSSSLGYCTSWPDILLYVAIKFN